MRLDITATDRQGHKLETRSISAHNYQSSYDQRLAIYSDYNQRYADYMGAGPYIFVNCVYTPPTGLDTWS